MQIQKKFKILFTLTLLFINGTIFAQSLTVLGGGNYTNLAYKQGSGADIEDTYKEKIGFHVGAYLDYVLNKDKSQEIVVEGGLLFDTKGSVQDQSEIGIPIENTWSTYYVDVPVLLKYRYRFRSLNKVYIGVGPYVGFGLFGNKKIKQEGQDQTSESIKWGNDDAQHDMKRLDYGATARVGFLAVSGLDISVSYDYGIPNIASMGRNIEMKNRVMRLSVGYNFSLVD